MFTQHRQVLPVSASKCLIQLLAAVLRPGFSGNRLLASVGGLTRELGPSISTTICPRLGEVTYFHQ